MSNQEEAQLPAKETPLPKKPLFVLSTIIFSEAFAINMLFPILASMVHCHSFFF